jgi:predicted MPP superfamily phosphohydrolase
VVPHEWKTLNSLGFLVTRAGLLQEALWFVCFGLPVEIWNIGVAVSALKKTSRLRFRVSPARLVRFIAVMIVIFVIRGLYEAHSITLQTVEISTSKLPPGTRPLSIVQISDLHLGLLVGQKHICDRMLTLTRQAKPDMIVCTGDLLDSTSERLSEIINSMAALNPPLGKFAVLGNHEFYIGAADSIDVLTRMGFRILRAENVLIPYGGTNICIAGVDNPAGRQMKEPCMLDENKALPDGARPFTILLKHKPVVKTASLGRFDLQLSGHIHGGQIFPFQIAVWLAYNHFTGLHKLSNGSHLYVSPGVGTWGPPIRIFAPPSITRLIIKPSLPIQ